MSDRYELSDRAASTIASCILQNLGKVDEEGRLLVIDKSKVRREKRKFEIIYHHKFLIQRYWEYILMNEKITHIIKKKMKTKYIEGRKKDHISLVQYPGGQYMGHLTPESGIRSDIVKSILCHLES